MGCSLCQGPGGGPADSGAARYQQRASHVLQGIWGLRAEPLPEESPSLSKRKPAPWIPRATEGRAEGLCGHAALCRLPEQQAGGGGSCPPVPALRTPAPGGLAARGIGGPALGRPNLGSGRALRALCHQPTTAVCVCKGVSDGFLRGKTAKGGFRLFLKLGKQEVIRMIATSGGNNSQHLF